MDHIDGEHTQNVELGQKFCDDTILFLQHHLGLGLGIEPTVEDPANHNLRRVWEHVHDAYSNGMV